MSSRARREFPGATAYRDRHGARRWRYRKGAFSVELGRDYGSPDFVRRPRRRFGVRRLESTR